MICLLSMFQYVLMDEVKLTAIYSLHAIKYKSKEDIANYVVEYRRQFRPPVFNCSFDILIVLREGFPGLSMLSNYLSKRKFSNVSKRIYIPNILINGNDPATGFVCEFYKELNLHEKLYLDSDNPVLILINSLNKSLEKIVTNAKNRIIYMYDSHISKTKKISSGITKQIIKEDTLEIKCFILQCLKKESGDMPLVISIGLQDPMN